VVVNHRASAPQAEEVVAAIAAAGGEAVAIKADVTVPDDVTAMVGEIDQRWDGVDVLVHNALIPYAITSFDELTWEQLGGKLDREHHAGHRQGGTGPVCPLHRARTGAARDHRQPRRASNCGGNGDDPAVDAGADG